MTNDNPLEVESLLDLEEAVNDFYAMRGYVPARIYVDKKSFRKITTSKPYINPDFDREFELWTPQGSSTIVKADDTAQMPFNYNGYGNYGNSSPKKKCCDKPTIIVNEALGKKFYVCKNCKQETDKDGFPC